ncbi:MAG: FGGY family carbohydrate kinase [candidate division NC10 bacterium]|nr:FGGY family carbohydrate kinase [candidate division NC10 bacterium]
MGKGCEKAYLMGVDAGTTNIKAAVFDLEGNLVAQSSQPIANYSPLPGYSEMDPEEIWSCTQKVIRQCALAAPTGKILAVGFSATKGCLLLLDEKDRPLTPLITWRDGRAHELYRSSGLDLYGKTGVPASGDTLPKLMWFVRYRPEILRRVARVLVSQKDYLLHRLLGEFVIDKSLGQTSMLFSLQTLDWDEELLSLGGIRRSQLPTLMDDTEIVGRLSRPMASALALLEGTAVVVGGDDGCMSQVGLGAVFPGRLGANIGTGAAIRAFTRHYVLDPLRMLDCKCLLPYGFVQTGITADAGRLLQWFEEGFCRHRESGESESASTFRQDLADSAGEIPPGCEGLLFFPYFTLASSTVLKGAQAKGVLFGLNYQHRSPHLVRAIMEAIGLVFKNITDRMESLGLPVEEVVLGGGGSRSPVWRQIISHILGRPVLKPGMEGASSLGAAIMASIGAGCHGGLEEAVSAMVKERKEERCDPDPSLHERYLRIQGLFNRIYASLEPSFQDHQEIWKEEG